MGAADRLEIDRVAANVGKALEAYERKLAIRPGRFDAFVAGDREALSAREQEGANVFFEAGCDGCHAGPLFTDDAFHAVGLSPGERGRAQGLEALAKSPFSAAGVFHDGPKESIPAPTAADEGAWRTPSLRNVSRTAPYGHDGSLPSLEAVLEAHGAAGLSAGEQQALVAFLEALDAGDPPSPWNNWPNR
jgi:cytochrome c peroxidase